VGSKTLLQQNLVVATTATAMTTLLWHLACKKTCLQLSLQVMFEDLVKPTIIPVNKVTTTTTVLRPFFRDHLGELVPEENFWTLWCKGRLTEADTQTIRLSATPSGLTSAHLHHPPIFYRPDALPAAQPTVSKH